MTRQSEGPALYVRINVYSAGESRIRGGNAEENADTQMMRLVYSSSGPMRHEEAGTWRTCVPARWECCSTGVRGSATMAAVRRTLRLRELSQLNSEMN